MSSYLKEIKIGPVSVSVYYPLGITDFEIEDGTFRNEKILQSARDRIMIAIRHYHESDRSKEAEDFLVGDIEFILHRYRIADDDQDRHNEDLDNQINEMEMGKYE